MELFINFYLCPDMQETIALLNNNLFFAVGVKKYIPDYELKNISSTELEEKNIWSELEGIKLVLIQNNFASKPKTLTLTKSLLEKNFKVIYLTSSQDKLIPKLFSSGCQGIINLENIADRLKIAIEAVLIGDTYYLQDLLSNPYAILLGSLAELFEDLEATVDLLTSKEKEIFDLYVSGNSLVAIMNKLAIAKSTIHTHMESIRAKFKVEANRELITKYQIRQIKVDKSEN